MNFNISYMQDYFDNVLIYCLLILFIIICLQIVYVARNPKETCISYYHHGRLLEAYNGNLDEFCKLFLAGRRKFIT